MSESVGLHSTHAGNERHRTRRRKTYRQTIRGAQDRVEPGEDDKIGQGGGGGEGNVDNGRREEAGGKDSVDHVGDTVGGKDIGRHNVGRVDHVTHGGANGDILLVDHADNHAVHEISRRDIARGNVVAKNVREVGLPGVRQELGEECRRQGFKGSIGRGKDTVSDEERRDDARVRGTKEVRKGACHGSIGMTYVKGPSPDKVAARPA